MSKLGSLFTCKFCKETIVDSNYIDDRKAPIFDEIYHKDCHLIITKKLQIENHNLKQKLEKIEALLPIDEFDNVIIKPEQLKEILESNPLRQLDSGLADNPKKEGNESEK